MKNSRSQSFGILFDKSGRIEQQVDPNTIEGLRKLVNDIPVGKADGLDGIPTCLLKMSFTFIASSLTHF